MFQQVTDIAGLPDLLNGEGMHRLIHIVHDTGTLYCHTVDDILSRPHLDCAYITSLAISIVGAIADKTALHDDMVGLSRNHEATALITDASCEKC